MAVPTDDAASASTLSMVRLGVPVLPEVSTTAAISVSLPSASPSSLWGMSVKLPSGAIWTAGPSPESASESALRRGSIVMSTYI